MSANKKPLPPVWNDDDIPEWSDDQFDHAEFAVGADVLRPANGTMARRGRPKSDDPKQQVTLRLDSIVLDRFRAMGPRWQSRINAELRKVLGI
jgi:uncharacterized protein (DUF4415 family)